MARCMVHVHPVLVPLSGKHKKLCGQPMGGAPHVQGQMIGKDAAGYFLLRAIHDGQVPG